MHQAGIVAAAQPDDVEARRAETLRVEIDLARLELARARGELVAVDDYERSLGRMLDVLMSRLGSIPVRLSHRGDAFEVEAEVEAIITKLHKIDEDVLEETVTPPPDAPDSETARPACDTRPQSQQTRIRRSGSGGRT